MKLFKEGFAWAAPIAVIAIIALFSVNLFAQGDPKVKELPIALIVNDEGYNVEHLKQVIDEAGKGVNGEKPTLKFTFEKESDIEDLFNDKKYYAALVIPEGYNNSLYNLLITNEPAKILVYVNQGFNYTGSNVAKTALNGIVQNVSNIYSTNLINTLGESKISAESAKAVANPIITLEKVYNPITTSTANGSAPTLMAVPAWVGALIGGFILFLALSKITKRDNPNRKDRLKLMLGQVLFGVLIALFSGFTVATLALIAGINMPNYLLVALFVSYAAFCFFLLVSAITAWIGKPAITLFMVVMLLGMGVLMTPQEMLPSFFVNFIRPWVPIRFASEGLREIFYFGSGFYTGQSFMTILYIGIAGFLILFLSIFKTKKEKTVTTEETAQ